MNSSVTITVTDVLNKLEAPDPYSITKSSVNPSTFYTPGDYSVTVSATSSNRQTSSCVASVKVVKQDVSQGPRITCKNYTTHLKQGGVYVQGFELLDISGCGFISSVSLSQHTFTSAGTYPVTLTAYGNAMQGTSQCQAFISILNQEVNQSLFPCNNYYQENLDYLKHSLQIKYKLTINDGNNFLNYIDDKFNVVCKDYKCDHVITNNKIYLSGNIRFKWEFYYGNILLYIGHDNNIYNINGILSGKITEI